MGSLSNVNECKRGVGSLMTVKVYTTGKTDVLMFKKDPMLFVHNLRLQVEVGGYFVKYNLNECKRGVGR